MARGDYRSCYDEREITSAVDLCDERGRLNPAAIGWSRQPLVRANLNGHWPRKKRWNFWNWISPRFVFSVTLADIDYAAFCQVTFTDFETKQSLAGTALARPHSFPMPEHVDRAITFRGGGMEYANGPTDGGLKVDFTGQAKSGESIVADFVVHRPAGHETLNIVVPWSATRFQLNSKSNTMPCEGIVTVAGRRYVMDPAECHAVQDFGRGVWPYRSFWNWGVSTGVQDGIRIGVNVGAKWTTGTGDNENGLCINGRLYKIMEDLHWQYDRRDWKQPWRVRAEHTRMVDLTLQPIVAHQPMLNVGVLRSGGVCAFGRWQGTIRFDGNEVRVRDLIGWAEEFEHRW
ncbi:MAG: DUF2804 domain-containing protein [Deltaproteobacteria bacterium]|nr:DUF2804 domain-containing protein [Deltaproteobacteria bacterium]MBI3389332.1 DUF2804 domain-containing protein [Deltaproteobacteria bacterium]